MKEDINNVNVDINYLVKSIMEKNTFSESDIAKGLGISIKELRERLNKKKDISINELEKLLSSLGLPLTIHIIEKE